MLFTQQLKLKCQELNWTGCKLRDYHLSQPVIYEAALTMICPTFASRQTLHLNRILSVHRCKNRPPALWREAGVPACAHATGDDAFSGCQTTSWNVVQPSADSAIERWGRRIFWQGWCLPCSRYPSQALHIQLTSQCFILPGVPRARLFWRGSLTLHAQHNVKPAMPLTSGKLAYQLQSRCSVRFWSCSH